MVTSGYALDQREAIVHHRLARRAASTDSGETTASQVPVSLDRIRAALQEPPPVLHVPAESGEKPTFRVEVRQATLRPVEQEPPFDHTYGLPSAGELLMDGVAKIQSAVVNYKHNRAERRAQKEVADALAALCAVRECPAPHTPK